MLVSVKNLRIVLNLCRKDDNLDITEKDDKLVLVVVGAGYAPGEITYRIDNCEEKLSESETSA